MSPTSGGGRASRAWPSASAYVAAVQDPSALAVAELVGASPRAGAFGMPVAVAGQHAIVVPFDGPHGSVACKCFTTPPDDATRHRYRVLAQHLRTVDAPLVDVAWHDRGVVVDGQPWPVVTMPWLPGTTLDLAVADRLDDAEALRAMADGVVDLVAQLAAARIAHGDLQHGNVLVEPDGRLHLVDYDATWVPGAEGLRPDELGHRAYQHPARLAEGSWGPWIDVVPGLVVHLSLLAVAAEPGLWGWGHDGENLLLGPDDLRHPEASDMLAALRASPDRRVAELSELLVRCLAAPPASLGSLDRLLRSDGAPTAVEVRAPGARPDWLAAAAEAVPADGAGSDGSAAASAGAPPADAEFDWPAPRRWRRRRRG